MDNFKNAWEQMKKKERVLLVLNLVCSTTIIVLSMIHLLGIWEKAIYVYEPLMGVVMLIQAAQNWKRSKMVAIFSFCTAMFIFAVAFIVIFLK